MKKILIYSSNICPYCIAAKRLLENLNLKFQEKVIDNQPSLRNEMCSVSNGRNTVPQIFIGDKHIGGYDDLKMVYENGELMRLIDE